MSPSKAEAKTWLQPQTRLAPVYENDNEVQPHFAKLKTIILKIKSKHIVSNHKALKLKTIWEGKFLFFYI